jgi:hypothetical protein
MAHQHTELADIVAARCTRPMPPAVMEFAASLADKYGAPTQAVLAYGSCLRDVDITDGLIDLYVLVDDYANVHASPWARFGNAAVPPNVYYGEHTVDGQTLRAKYAVVTVEQFERKLSPNTANPYFWARFAQPCAIAFSTSAKVRDRLAAALTVAVRTFLSETRALAPVGAGAEDRWAAGLVATYATELRPEATSRARAIVDAEAEYYRDVTRAFDAEPAELSSAGRSGWFSRRVIGRALSVARLAKAAFTFQGGADYLAWKIARHSNVKITVKPWHRRHPILAAIVLSPRLYLRGGFR